VPCHLRLKARLSITQCFLHELFFYESIYIRAQYKYMYVCTSTFDMLKRCWMLKSRRILIQYHRHARSAIHVHCHWCAAGNAFTKTIKSTRSCQQSHGHFYILCRLHMGSTQAAHRRHNYASGRRLRKRRRTIWVFPSSSLTPKELELG
jgi:hypothetical protein